eukprot:829594_1
MLIEYCNRKKQPNSQKNSSKRKWYSLLFGVQRLIYSIHEHINHVTSTTTSTTATTSSTSTTLPATTTAALTTPNCQIYFAPKYDFHCILRHQRSYLFTMDKSSIPCEKELSSDRDVFDNWTSNIAISFASVIILLLSPSYVVYYCLFALLNFTMILIALYYIFKLPSPSASAVHHYRKLFSGSVFGHRGCVHIDSIDQGTQNAFKYAYDANARGIECDLRLTSDGHPVIVHDYHIKHLTDSQSQSEKLNLSSVNVHELTLKQIKDIRLKHSEASFLSLYELVEFMNENVYRAQSDETEFFCLLLEFKHCVHGYTDSDIDKIMSILSKVQFVDERVLFISFSMSLIYRLRKRYKEIHVGLIFERHMWYNWIKNDSNIVAWKHCLLHRFLDPIHTFVCAWIFPYFCGCVCVGVEHYLLSQFSIQHYRKDGIFVFCRDRMNAVDIKWLLSNGVCCVVDNPRLGIQSSLELHDGCEHIAVQLRQG